MIMNAHTASNYKSLTYRYSLHFHTILNPQISLSIYYLSDTGMVVKPISNKHQNPT